MQSTRSGDLGGDENIADTLVKDIEVVHFGPNADVAVSG